MGASLSLAKYRHSGHRGSVSAVAGAVLASSLTSPVLSGILPFLLLCVTIWTRKRKVQKNSASKLVVEHQEEILKILGHKPPLSDMPMPNFVRSLLVLVLNPWITVSSLWAMMKEHRHLHFLRDLHRVCGVETFVASLPTQATYVVTMGAENVEHILKTKFDNYVKGERFMIPRLKELLGNGIFNADGRTWYHQRKTASHMFTQKLLTNHIWRVIRKNTDKLVKLLRETPTGTVVDIFNLMNRFTLDTIGEIGFARNIGSLDNANSPFLKSFDRAQQTVFLRMVLPFWRLRRFFRLGDESDSAFHFKLLRDYSRDTVRALKTNLGGEQGESFVGLFMREEEKQGKAHDEEFMQDMVLNFLIAGRDTTAQSLSWTFYLLLQHPDVETRVLEEIEDVCGGGRDVEYDDLNRMTFLQAVVNESLRLYPSVPMDIKTAVGSDTLPDGTLVEKGDVVLYNIFAMGRSKKLWGEDADEFKPERWLNREFPSLYSYPVFNAGARECLGRRLAWLEMKACLVNVLRAVKLKLAVPPEAIHYDTQLTLGMSSGLPCHAVAR